MENGQWHAVFNPQKFLARIDINKLIEHNEAYNENKVDRLTTPCILCSGLSTPGLLLNDKSYLCKECFSLTSTIAAVILTLMVIRQAHYFNVLLPQKLTRVSIFDNMPSHELRHRIFSFAR